MKPIEKFTTWYKELPKKRQIAYASGAGVVLVCLIALIWWAGLSAQYRQDVAATASPSPKVTTAPTPTPTPALAASNLNGAMVPAGTENMHPLAVMIENHPDARPQSGLGSADLVYEAIAEGGITRFMAVFGNPTAAVRVGPIRSSRPYYVDFATELNAFYAHVGGSVDALAQIKATGVLDLDGGALGEPIFKRDLSKNVAIEHTMYSSTDKLWDRAINVNHWATAANYSPWKFQDDAASDKRATAQSLSVKVSDPLYDVQWTYDPATNVYKRSMAGAPHVDANTGKQIEVKNVVLETVQRSDYTETYGSINKTVGKYTLTGTGTAVIFQNGVAIKGTWKKQGTERTRYYDESGQEISFVRGPIWVHLVEDSSKITY